MLSVENKKLRIAVSTSLLSPYRVDWFDELGKYADVDVYYLHSKNAERKDEWLSKRSQNCNFYYLKGFELPKLGKISFSFISAIKKTRYDIIILDGYGYSTQVINIHFLNARGVDYFVNMDGILNTSVSGDFKSRFKTNLIRSIPYFLCGSLSARQYALNCGVDQSRVFNHVFTSLFKSDIYNDIADGSEKNELKKQLQIQEEKVVISVGRFSYMNGYGKGYDVLLKAAGKLSKNIGWYIVGDQPTNEFLALKEKNQLDNVHFVGYKCKEELKRYYRASDLFVLMSVGDVWGLVVNEAMACGLPVITSDKCVAGVELIENGENGYVIPVGDSDDLAKKIDSVIFNQPALQKMGKRSLSKISDCTIENMAKRHIEIFESILSQTDNAK